MDFLYMPNADNMNEFLFKMSQMPEKWFYKSTRLYRDSLILYKNYQRTIDFFIKELDKLNFFKNPDSRRLKELIYDILAGHPKRSLPDFCSYYLLSAFCLENLIKGYIVMHNIDFIGESKLNKKLKEHNLYKLCYNYTNIKLSESEQTLLQKLSDYSIAYGRYPVRATVNNNTPFYLQPDYDVNYTDLCVKCVENPYIEDHKIYRNIYKKINLRIKKYYTEQKQLENSKKTFSEELKFAYSETN